VAPELLDDGSGSPSCPYLALELLHGASFRDWLESAREESSSIPLEHVLTTFCVLCDTVESMHERGVLHRDLKPQNIFLVGSGRAVPRRVALLDFGVARMLRPDALGDGLTHKGQRLGTPHYMAPEQCRGELDLDVRADVYALGAILFESICGRPPFEGEDATSVESAQLHEPPPRPSELADVPSCLDDIVIQCLAKEREMRPPSALAVAQALLGALAGAERRQERLGRSMTTRKRARRTTGQVRTGALLGLRATAPASVVCAAAERESGWLVYCSDGTFVIAFAHASVDEEVEASMRVAQRLRGHFTSAIVHVAVLRVRQNGATMHVTGGAILQPESWLGTAVHHGNPEGVVLTPDAVEQVRSVATVEPAFGQYAVVELDGVTEDQPTALRCLPRADDR
jgi:hypothetical protein